MNVLIVTGIFPPDIGGPATYVPNLAKGLTERGHRVRVLTLSERTDVPDGYDFEVVRVARAGAKGRRLALTAYELVRLQRQADVVLANGLVIEAAAVKVLTQRPLVLKVVGDLAWERARVRGRTQDEFDDFQQRRYDALTEALRASRNWALRRADRLIASGAYQAGWLRRWGAQPERIATIHNAMDPLHVPEARRSALPGVFQLVTAARLVTWKRVDQLILTLKALPDVGLTVIGDGPEKASLEALAQAHGLSARVAFLGSLTRSETLAQIAGADAFVLCSSWEGFAHVVVEAMGLGIPVVVSDVGGAAEVVRTGATGILVNTQQELLSAIESLKGDLALRRRLGAQAQALIQEKFSVPLMVDRTQSLLSEVVEQHASAQQHR